MNHCPAQLLHRFPFVPMGLVGNYYIYVLVDGARLAVTWVAAQVFLSYCVIFILYQGQAKYLHSTAVRASPTKHQLSHRIKLPPALLPGPLRTAEVFVAPPPAVTPSNDIIVRVYVGVLKIGWGHLFIHGLHYFSGCF